MKYIKNRQRFIKEAKIRDLVLPSQAKEVSSYWGEKFLDYEEVDPTDKIKQGYWKLEEEDKMKVLGHFFDCDMKSVMDIFRNLSDKFNTIAKESINLDLLTDKQKIIMKDINFQTPTIDQIIIVYDNVFRKLAISETQASEMVQKDESGRPVRDEEGNMLRTKKNPGDPIFTSNLTNINSFVDDFNRCYSQDRVESNFQSRDINSLRNLAKEDFNSRYVYDFEIFNRDLYLEISHNPKDILNMSISRFYTSCQHLYTGGYRSQLLSNVFDPNSIPAFFVFDTPIFLNDEKISDKLPLSRMMIRNIENFDDVSETKIFFDRAYPDRMKDIFDELTEKYSGNIQNVTDDRETYVFTPDVDIDDSKIQDPYMDKLRLRREKFIGLNTKTLYLNRTYDWSKIKISPKAKIKELIIETTDIPENLLKIDLNPEWIKFKFLKIETLTGFDKIKTDSIAFDKCKFDTKLFEDIYSSNPTIKRLQITSCDLSGDFNFKIFENLEELHLVYTLDSIEDIKESLTNLKIKKLVLSGDLITDKSVKEFINELRKRGIRIEIVGPVI
jgi:hypothetical protein